MKIAFLVFHDIHRNDGVTQKIANQIKAWTKSGNTVRLFAIVPSTKDNALTDYQYKLTHSVLWRLTKDRRLIKDVTSFSPDIIYFRYDTWNRSLANLTKRYCSIAEMNTLDLAEFKTLNNAQRTLKSSFRLFGYVALRGRLLSKLDAAIAVTNEIADAPSYTKYGFPTTCVPNGIDLSTVDTTKSHEPKSSSTSRLKLFFIGTPNQPWHGLDKILVLASKLPDFEFHIVGSEGKDTKNVFWHGYLAQDQYLEVLRQCHICIGSLAMYRNNLTEGCPLKVREYLARGYPIIIGYRDSAFLNHQPDWVLQITDDTPIETIKQFVVQNAFKKVPREELGCISTDQLEYQRVAFFNKIIESKKQ